MLCEEVTALLPAMVDGEHDADPAVALHVETCLRCQAELARYRAEVTDWEQREYFELF